MPDHAVATHAEPDAILATPAAAGAVLPLLPAQMLAMQRTAGNAATVRWLGTARPPLQRAPLRGVVGQTMAQLMTGNGLLTLRAARELTPPDTTPEAFGGYDTEFHAVARAALEQTAVAVVRDPGGRFHALDSGSRPIAEEAIGTPVGSGWTFVRWVRLQQAQDETAGTQQGPRPRERYAMLLGELASRRRDLADPATSAARRAAIERELSPLRRELAALRRRSARTFGIDTPFAQVPAGSSGDVGAPAPARPGEVELDPWLATGVRGRAGIPSLPQGEHDPVPSFGLRLGTEVVDGDQISAIETLAHEATHYGHAQRLTALLAEWQRARAARRTRATLLGWLAQQRRRGQVTAVELALATQATSGDISGTQILATVEGFTTGFHRRQLTSEPPELTGNFSQLDELLGTWTVPRTEIHRAALARLEHYYEHGLDAAHQASFDLWVTAAIRGAGDPRTDAAAFVKRDLLDALQALAARRRPPAAAARLARQPAPSAPRLRSLEARVTGRIAVLPGYSADVFRLSFGDAPAHVNGVLFTAQVDVPPGLTGRLLYVQHLFVRRSHISRPGNQEEQTESGGWKLDTHDPYWPEDGFALPLQRAVESGDAPATGLYPETERADVDDLFHTWLLWEPVPEARERRVALGHVFWRWSAKARRIAPGASASAWQIVEQSAHGAAGVPTTLLPPTLEVYDSAARWTSGPTTHKRAR